MLELLHQARMLGKKHALGIMAIAEHAKLSVDECEQLLYEMLDLGWIARLNPGHGADVQSAGASEESDRWALLCHPGRLRVIDVYRAFSFPSVTNGRLAQRLDKAIESGLNQCLSVFSRRRQANLKVIQTRSSKNVVRLDF